MLTAHGQHGSGHLQEAWDTEPIDATVACISACHDALNQCIVNAT
jgi:hypothetical protein